MLVESGAENGLVQVRTEHDQSMSLTPEFKAWLDKTTEENKDLIRELAKK